MEETKAEVPQYKDGSILYDGVVFALLVTNEENAFYGKAHMHRLINPAPGEVPQRVRGGFAYGGRIFMPKECLEHASLKKDEQKAALKELRLRGREEFTRQTSRIPEEHWPEVLRRRQAGDNPREIADWLREEKQVATSHSSVSRLCQRLLAAEPDQDAAAKIMGDLEGQKLHYIDAMSRLEALSIEAFRRAKVGDQDDDPAMERAFRYSRAEAQLLDRQIRHLTSRLPKPPPPKPEPAWMEKERQLQAMDAQRDREAQAAAEPPREEPPAPLASEEETAEDVEWEKKRQKMLEESRKMRREVDAVLSKAGRILGVVLLITFAGLHSARAAIIDSAFERVCTPSGGPSTQFTERAAPAAYARAPGLNPSASERSEPERERVVRARARASGASAENAKNNRADVKLNSIGADFCGPRARARARSTRSRSGSLRSLALGFRPPARVV